MGGEEAAEDSKMPARSVDDLNSSHILSGFPPQRKKRSMAINNRRNFLKMAAGSIAAIGSGFVVSRSVLAAGLSDGTIASAVMETVPGKKALIKRSYRPLNLETPTAVFNSAITPNDQFFVRWHFPEIPTIDPGKWRLRIAGNAAAVPLELSLAQLKRDFEAVEVVAVCQCAGNRRGLSDPHVPGIEWGDGAMGNARWKGARLKDVLQKAGINPDAVEVAFDGAEKPVLDKTPDFRKSIPLWKALDENTLLAYEMNGEPLPHLNGAPVRVVVPGWAATYWIKALATIDVLNQPLQGFWMNPAYRLPKGLFPQSEPFASQENETSVPVTSLVVNSLIANVVDGQKFGADGIVEVQGVAWDSGHGIKKVEVSTDGGTSWNDARVDSSLGRFSFHLWRYRFVARERGKLVVMAKATSNQGETQVFQLKFNPAGYHNNVVKQINLEIV